jgi:hypothetical protein
MCGLSIKNCIFGLQGIFPAKKENDKWQQQKVG